MVCGRCESLTDSEWKEKKIQDECSVKEKYKTKISTEKRKTNESSCETETQTVKTGNSYVEFEIMRIFSLFFVAFRKKKLDFLCNVKVS